MKATPELSGEQRRILETLFTQGATKQSAFDAADLGALRSAMLICDNPPDRVAITVFGQDWLQPPHFSKGASGRPANGRDSRSDSREDTLPPLSDKQRDMLGQIGASGVPSGTLDGRTEASLLRLGLIAVDADRAVLTPAGAKRAPRTGRTSEISGEPQRQNGKPSAKPAVELAVAIEADTPQEAIDTQRRIVDAVEEGLTVPDDDLPVRNFVLARPNSVRASSDTREQLMASPEMLPCADCAKARLLDMLLARSPAVRRAFDALNDLDAALARLDRGR